MLRRWLSRLVRALASREDYLDMHTERRQMFTKDYR